MCGNPRDRFQELVGRPPEEAKFFWTGGPVQVAERTFFASMFSGVTAFETDEGLVLVDTGMARLAPGLAALLRQVTPAPVHTVIYSHGHVDHAFGLAPFLLPGQAPPRIIGQRRMLDRFARYDRTRHHNAALNARQFDGCASASSGEEYDTFGYPKHPPNLLYDDALDIEVGGVRFSLRHALGETDDHTWVYCPDRGVLCPGDLFIWGVPNAGNPQKAQRYPWSWAKALFDMVALAPRTICPGHGGPVIDDPALIARMLTETGEFLELIVERTLRLLENGSPPHVDVVRAIELPQSDSPWLQPVYDEAEFIVRTVLRHFGGWYSGRPSELKPAPRDALARTVAELSGGTERLLERALALVESGELRLACHLADFALEAAPQDPRVMLAVAEIYRRRAAGETSLMAVNLYRSAAAYASEGRPFA
ncbi:MAG: MBL fold metallo-hydrolase [Myxococcales bacterium]|nr:MBL fold metallo-hydrolase [Myxococcales bacterium]